jgi:AcrR family transcriptional regulator
MGTNLRSGRPRDQDVDAAILKAAVKILAEGGPGDLTINAVARRSGVARASIYLRYAGRDALVAATIRAAIGIEPFTLTGDIEADLRRIARQEQAILAMPSFRAVLPAVIAGLLRQATGHDPISIDTVAPNRQPIAVEYERLAAAAGLRTDIDPGLPGNLIVGAILMLLLVDGTPPTLTSAEEAVEIILAGLRAPNNQGGPS